MHPTPDTVSIIIPTYNEAAHVGELLTYLRQASGDEVGIELLVADGQSTDATVALARQAGAKVVSCPRKGRAAQLNYGARAAAGQVLYFLHADTRPPADFLAAIRRAVAQGAGSGCFRLAFDHAHWLLRLSGWATRFPTIFFRFGDQSLFVRRALFEQVGGYREELLLLEDQEIVARLRRHGSFRILPGPIVTSARKYLDNGVVRLQSIFLLLCGLYQLGVSQPALVRVYRALIRQDKI